MTDEEKVKLNEIAKEYIVAKQKSDMYAEKVKDLREKILKIIGNTSYLNESYQFTVSQGSRSTLKKQKVEETFESLNIKLDSSYFTITTYPTLKVVDLNMNPEKKIDSLEDDHRVKISLDDLKI